MTGEVTLRGLVLPVGGVKDKVLAAHRMGVKRVILPERNVKDLKEVPENVLKELEVREEPLVLEELAGKTGGPERRAVENAVLWKERGLVMVIMTKENDASRTTLLRKEVVVKL